VKTWLAVLDYHEEDVAEAPLSARLMSFATRRGSWAMNAIDKTMLPSNTITPTRMSVSYEADGSVHPIPIREVRIKSYLPYYYCIQYFGVKLM